MPDLQITCFGTLRVELGGEPVLNFETEKTRALLVYLAIESSRPHRREHLAGLLWSDVPEKRALQNLRQTILYLRKALGEDDASPPYLLATRDEVQLNPACNWCLDVNAFVNTLDEAFRHYQRRNGRGWLNIRPLQRGLAHFLGEFLEQFYLSGSPLFDEWAALQRENYNCRAIEALSLLADYHQRRGEFGPARQAAARIVDLAPWDETAQAQMMRLFALDKQWSAAQNQYMILRRYLHEQLGVEPSETTKVLFNEIRTAAANNTALAPRSPHAQHNLPTTPTPFVGREAVLDILSERLSDPECRLISLLGPGGIGKTRLALEAARNLVGIAEDGVFFVHLGTVSTSEHIPSAIADAMKFVITERGEPKTQVLNYLMNKHILLVLDNFEHLLVAQGSTNLLSEILQQASGVKLLVTTRERLHLQEECVFTLEGMAIPINTSIPIESWDKYDALKLFLQRARQVHPGFLFDATNLPSVIRICQLLDGLPLGVELAAAATWDCTCEEIAKRIATGFDDLKAYASNVPARHRSLRAAFDVSWHILTPSQQKIFCQCSVFRDGFDMEAYKKIVGESRNLSLPPEGLAILVEKSLVYRTTSGRYNLHEAVRQYGAGKLADTPTLDLDTRKQHAQYYAAFLVKQNENLKKSGQAAALEWIHQEIENIRSAWEWLIENSCALEISQCADSIYHYFNIRSHFSEGMKWFQLATGAFQNQEADRLTYGICLSRYGALAYRVHDNNLAEKSLSRCIEIFNRMEAPGETAFCQISMGGVMLRGKKYDRAQNLAEDSLKLYRALGDEWGLSYALYFLGLVKNRTGRFEEAWPLLTESVAISRQIGNQHRLVTPLNLLGDIACIKGDYEAAETYFQESLQITQTLNDLFNQAILLNNLATIYQAKSQFDQEQTVLEDSLRICRLIGDRDGEAIALNGLGEMAVHIGEYTQAIQYSQQAFQIARQVGESWTIIVCLNNLGEAYAELGETTTAETYQVEALKFANEIQAMDLVARVTITLGRIYQQRKENAQAIRLITAGLAYPVLDEEARRKGDRWLVEMGAQVTENIPTLEKLTTEILERQTGD